jgi:minor extracellular protease Epr
MKSVSLSCVLVVCLCPPAAYAQLLDTSALSSQVLNTDVLDRSARELEDVTGQVRRQLNDQLEPVLDSALDPLAKQTAKVLDPILDQVLVPLDALANELPILTRSGETAFVDVEVENGWRAVEREWLIMLDKAEVKLLLPLGADIIEQTNFAELDMVLVRFRVPAQWDSAAALKQRLPNHLHEQLDRNHIYDAQADIPAASAATPASFRAICDAPVKVGMIDTAINSEHPAFAKSSITVRDFLGEKFTAPRAHGTAVAGLLVGSGAALQPLLPKAQLYAASVFYPRNQYSQGATMMDLVRALNWLAGEKVSVINMSLAGPDNQILRSVISRIAKQGMVVIAAAGNEGPAAPPMYPAAYAEVIAVTAVDRAQKIYRWANRGDYVDFAALGVSVTTARSDGGFGRETGTSMAAPVVSAFAACELVVRNEKSALVVEGLARKVTDLGVPGRDPIFGFGLLDALAAVKAEQ